MHVYDQKLRHFHPVNSDKTDNEDIKISLRVTNKEAC